ncbi:MAG: PIN domain-containing protein [Dehalococcoidia bacterium]
MADALFDTTVFIDYYRRDQRARALMNAVLDGILRGSFSAVSAFEIWIGISSHEEEIDYISIMTAFEEVPLTASMARTAAIWLKDMPPRRAEALFRDALIAATAAERAETIYTRNVADFQRFYPNVQSY